jgi:hypothetical protein
VVAAGSRGAAVGFGERGSGRRGEGFVIAGRAGSGPRPEGRPPRAQ